jgi:hypothetical protein
MTGLMLGSGWFFHTKIKIQGFQRFPMAGIETWKR